MKTVNGTVVVFNTRLNSNVSFSLCSRVRVRWGVISRFRRLPEVDSEAHHPDSQVDRDPSSPGLGDSLLELLICLGDQTDLA
jgi:hypothetical protein